MKFLSAIGGALKKVGQGVDKATDIIDPFAPFIGALPVIGGPFGMIFKLIADAERLATDSTGAQKKAAVLSFVRLAYPNLDIALVSVEIDNLVGILNRLAKATPPGHLGGGLQKEIDGIANDLEVPTDALIRAIQGK